MYVYKLVFEWFFNGFLWSENHSKIANKNHSTIIIQHLRGMYTESVNFAETKGSEGELEYGQDEAEEIFGGRVSKVGVVQSGACLGVESPVAHMTPKEAAMSTKGRGHERPCARTLR